MATRKTGCWNWMPQPMVAPALLNPKAATASTRNENRMPAAVIRNPSLTRPRSTPPCSIIPRSLMDNTGSTQGMRLRMKPPKSARARMVNKVLKGAASSMPGTAVTVFSMARAPSTNVRVSRGLLDGTAVSPLTATGIRNSAILPPPEISTSGMPNCSCFGPSTRMSGLVNGRLERASTSSTGAASLPVSRTCSIDRPRSAPLPGTRAA